MADDHKKQPAEALISREDIERLRASGFAVVPLAPTTEMRRVGAPICYQAYDGDWDTALQDARECYLAMVECGCL